MWRNLFCHNLCCFVVESVLPRDYTVLHVILLMMNDCVMAVRTEMDTKTEVNFRTVVTSGHRTPFF